LARPGPNGNNAADACTVTRTTRLVISSAVAVAMVTTGFVGLASAPASADSLKARIAAAQRELNALDAQAEAASERYNAARIKLAAAAKTATSAQERLTAAQAKLGSLRTAVSAFAIAAYTGDALDSTTLSLTAENPQDFLDKLASLQAVTDSQQQALAAVASAQHDEASAQASAAGALAAQQASTQQMQADRNQVLAAASKEQEILGSLQAQEVAVEKAARVRAARLAAERAAAALAARRAAALFAARSLAGQGDSSSPIVAGSGGAPVAVQWAYKELGKPYVWGAAGPNSFDCSGLTQYVWAKAGVYLDHYTGSQWNEGRHVSRDQLQPGDLVFFGGDLHHVGIYIGGGKMIEAPHTGADVRISNAFRGDYAGAIRPGT
jgi:cell wall-associated NlpC family hydrolase